MNWEKLGAEILPLLLMIHFLRRLIMGFEVVHTRIQCMARYDSVYRFILGCLTNFRRIGVRLEIIATKLVA